MVSIFRHVLVCVLCVLPTLAQEFPIEVDLVAPPGMVVVEALVPQREQSSPQKTVQPIRVCSVCGQKTAIRACSCYQLLTQELAVKLLKKVENAVSQASSQRLTLKKRVGIRAVSRQYLMQLGGERLLGLYQDDVIWISQDLNQRRATAVIAHEFGHAWLFQHRKDIEVPTELLFEGFAEFVSHLALREIGDQKAANGIAFEDKSVYGRGARILIAWQKRQGLGAVLHLALNGKDAL